MNITFSKNDIDKRHFKLLNKKVRQNLLKISKNRIRYAQFRAIFFPILYVLLYLLALNFSKSQLGFTVCYGLMGIAMILIFLNLVHNAVHDSIFENRRLNKLLLYFFDLMGGNSYIWKKRHKFFHHRFQNIAGWDSDIEQASIFKIYPHEKSTYFHKFQPILIFVFYPIFLLNWLIIRDFKDFFSKNQLVRKAIKIPKIEYVKLFSFKLFYIFYIVVLPVILGIPVNTVLVAFVFMLVLAGIYALLVLLTPHVNHTNEFPLPNSDGLIESSWFQHQFSTTNDISMNSWVGRNFMGNFNFHLAHHLFPKLNSCYAPEVTEVIKKYAQENGLNYRSISLRNAFKSHYELIKNNARN